MTQTATSGRRRASVDQVHQQHTVASRTAHPTRRSLRRASPVSAAVDVASDARGVPEETSTARTVAPRVPRQTPTDAPTPTRASLRRAAAPRTSPLGRLRDKATAAGLVMASAGLALAAVAPSDAETDRTATAAAAAAAHELTFASSVTSSDAVGPATAAAVTAPASADVTFGLESAGPAADGLPPSIVSARSLSSSVSPTAKEREAFGLPVAGAEVASTFGYRVNPMGGYGSELHTGLDYASPCGTSVVAADDGTVVESGWHAFGGGQRIVVDHGDGMKTTYNHMSVLGVPAGTTVSRGASLGSVGSTGNSTGCHLHFEVMINDEKVDPTPWL